MYRLPFYIIILLTANLAVAQKSGTIRVSRPDNSEQIITASVANKSGGIITRERLMAADIVKVNDTVLVTSYIFSLTRESIKTNISVEGNEIPGDIKRYIKELRSGQIIQFQKIRALDKNGHTHKVYDIQFHIVN